MGVSPRRAFGAVTLVLALACSREAPRIDMTNAETAQRSTAAVEAALSSAERTRFASATSTVLLHALGPDRAAAAKDPEQAEARVKAALDGKTAAEVIAAAEAIERTAHAAPPQ